MAGLWETWRGPDGKSLASCTLIVTGANALVRTLHDRMPVVLAREDYAAWLDPGNQDAAGLLSMLRPGEPPAWELRQAPPVAAG